MKKILLTKGKTAIVDSEDYAFLAKNKWCYDESHNRNRYAYRSTYPIDGRHPKKIYMHRIIIGAENGQLVDHINRKTLDNRKCNLRIATRAENLFNSLYFESLIA